MNARLCVEQESHSFCEWIVLNGYCIASWVKWRYFVSRAREGSSARSFRNVLPFGSQEHTGLEHDSAIATRSSFATATTELAT